MRPFPIRVHAELTAVCNLSCPMCPRHFVDEKPGFMSWDLWRKIVDECSEYPEVTLIPFWRGESLLHPEFSDYIAYAKTKVDDVQITTNGTLINDKNIDALLQMSFVSVSIHNKASWEHAQWLLSRRHGSAPVLQVSFVEGEKTIERYMSELIQTPHLGGFDRVRYFDLHTEDGIFGSSKRRRDGSRNFCNKLNDYIVIDVDGQISRCSYVWVCEPDLSVRHQSIQEIWTGETYETIRRTYPDKVCGPCDQWQGVTAGKLYQKAGDTCKEFIF